LASVCAVVSLANGAMFSLDGLDELWWTLCGFLLIRLLNRRHPRL